MTRDAIQRHPTDGHRLVLYRVPATGLDTQPRLARLHVLTGPGRPRRTRPHHLPTPRGLDVLIAAGGRIRPASWPTAGVAMR